MPAFSVAVYAKAFVRGIMRSFVFNTWVGVAVLAARLAGAGERRPLPRQA